MLKRMVYDLVPTRMTRKLIMGSVLLMLVLMPAFVACAGPELTSIPASTQKSDPVAFQTDRLTVAPAEVDPGGVVVVTAIVTNTDDTDNSYAAELKINNVIEAVKELTMPAGGTQTLTFFVSASVPGPYTISFGELTEQFVVVNTLEQPQTSDPKVDVSDAAGSSVPGCCR